MFKTDKSDSLDHVGLILPIIHEKNRAQGVAWLLKAQLPEGWAILFGEQDK